MRTPKTVDRLTPGERLNFLVTNRIPRHALTRFMGWFSRIEHPLVAKLSIAAWQAFVDDLRLFEARKSRFSSLHDCFVRELKPGARPVDPEPDVVVSPCDAVVGASGSIEGDTVLQAKGFPYSLADLTGDASLADRYRGGYYVTLRLKSSMYHRFHAPCDARVHRVCYISGDTWNVNPVTLRVIERLFCKNERAVIELDLAPAEGSFTLVPVAAVLVASMRLNGIDVPLNLDYRGPNLIPWQREFSKGAELGWFEHGSTIIVLASRGFSLSPSIAEGRTVRMGQPLLDRG